MILVIDCFKLVKGAGKSIGIYNLALNLVRELSRQNTSDTIIVLGNSYNRKDFAVEGVEFKEINKNPLNKITCVFWELFEVSILAKKLKADKALFPRGYASMLHLTKEYVIIHDMIPFYYNEHYPGYFNRLENFYIMWRLKASARHADKVITISEASKNDIIKYSHTNEGRISVINNGYNAIKSMDNTKNGEGKDCYIVSITSGLPHKNAAGVVKAYDTYFKKAQNPLPITVIGIQELPETDTPISSEALENITFIKYIDNNEELHRIIRGASAFLFMSLVEGFGFPPIEAMQLETPVVCSNMSSLPEVVGDAAFCVNPDDYEEVADALIKVTTDRVLADSLRQKGKINAERFNWQKTGERYREVLFDEV